MRVVRAVLWAGEAGNGTHTYWAPAVCSPHIVYSILTTYSAAITVKPFYKWGNRGSEKLIDFAKGRKILNPDVRRTTANDVFTISRCHTGEKKNVPWLDVPLGRFWLMDFWLWLLWIFTILISNHLYIPGKRHREDDRLAPGLLRYFCIFLN